MIKITISLFCFVAGMQTGFAQSLSIDSMMQKIVAEKDEDKKVSLISNSLYGWPGFDSSTTQMISIGQAMIKERRRKKTY